MGIGEAKEDEKILNKAQEELSLIAGQKAIITKAKKAISVFKIREGMKIGVSVTLRNKVMYEFLDRLINITLPQIRDFRGLNPKVLMVMVIFHLVLKSKLFFQKLIMIKLIKFVVWILQFVQVLIMMKKH